MPSKRLRSKNPSVSGGGGGATTQDVPFATWGDDATTADDFRVISLLAEDATTDDAIRLLLLTNPENATADDSLTIPLMLSDYAEDATTNDLTKVIINTVDVSRSGTPDSDKMFDGYANQLAASAGTNFGNANLLVKGVSTAPGSDAENGYIVIDLTDLTNFTAGGTGFTLTYQASQNALLAATTDTLVWTLTRSATKPFTESTMTWNTKPAAGTAVSNGTNTVSGANTVGTFTATATAAQIAPALGQWLMCTFTAATAALPNTFTVISRDQAANRPTWTLNYIQRGT